MHGQHAGPGHEVVHDREHRLLELTGVARAADENHPLREVQDDERAGARSVTNRIGLKLRRMQHREVRLEGRQLTVVRANEHVPHERGVPGVRHHVADTQAMGRFRTAAEVLHEELGLLLQIGANVAVQCVEVFRRVRLVDLSPIDVSLGGGLADDELVVGRTPVCGAVTATKGPMSANSPSPRRAAASMSSGATRFQWTCPLGRSPCCSSPLVESGAPGTGLVSVAMFSNVHGQRFVVRRGADQMPTAPPRSVVEVRDCASITATAAMFTISCTSAPCSSTCTGWRMPMRIGPMAVAPPS